MFNWWTERRARAKMATEIYGAIVARARNPAFYASCGVSDTPEGRYELVVLTLFLVLEPMRLSAQANTDQQRLVVEAFVTDMDDCLREMGVGDLTVPRKVKRAAAGLMERMDQYRTALAAPDDTALCAALAANIPGLAATPGGSAALALSVRADSRHLAALADSAIGSGGLSFSNEPVAPKRT